MCDANVAARGEESTHREKGIDADDDALEAHVARGQTAFLAAHKVACTFGENVVPAINHPTIKMVRTPRKGPTPLLVTVNGRSPASHGRHPNRPTRGVWPDQTTKTNPAGTKTDANTTR